MEAYITKDKSGLVQLWNNKPEFNKHTGCWQSWIIKGISNEVGIDITNNDLFREKITFDISPKKISL